MYERVPEQPINYPPEWYILANTKPELVHSAITYSLSLHIDRLRHRDTNEAEKSARIDIEELADLIPQIPGEKLTVLIDSELNADGTLKVKEHPTFKPHEVVMRGIHRFMNKVGGINDDPHTQKLQKEIKRLSRPKRIAYALTGGLVLGGITWLGGNSFVDSAVYQSDQHVAESVINPYQTSPASITVDVGGAAILFAGAGWLEAVNRGQREIKMAGKTARRKIRSTKNSV